MKTGHIWAGYWGECLVIIKVIREWRKLHVEELHDLYVLTYFISLT